MKNIIDNAKKRVTAMNSSTINQILTFITNAYN